VTTSQQPGSGAPPQPGPWRPRRRRGPARRPRRPATRTNSPLAALPDWDTLDGPDLQAAWAGLVGWVTWLHDRYELSAEERLPHCWAEHPGLVEELSALKAWHDEIYGAEQPSGQAVRYWHAELRQTITAALTFYAAGCRAGHHAGIPATPQLRERWAAATPPGTPGPSPPTAADYLPGVIMTAHLSAGRATTLSDTITGYLRHDRSWRMPAEGGWQRVADPATTTLLDHHAQAMARADQVVRQAAAARQAGG
jgi:hypothetical protein